MLFYSLLYACVYTCVICVSNKTISGSLPFCCLRYAAFTAKEVPLLYDFKMLGTATNVDLFL